MRPVLDGDLIALARVVMRWPEAGRAERLKVALDRIEAADRLRQHTGRGHPLWGSGAIQSYALGLPMGPRAPGNAAYLRALAQVCDALLSRMHDGNSYLDLSSRDISAYVVGSDATRE